MINRKYFFRCKITNNHKERLEQDFISYESGIVTHKSFLPKPEGAIKEIKIDLSSDNGVSLDNVEIIAFNKL